MRTVKIGLCALVFAAFASVFAVAQTGSGTVPERLNRRIESLSKKALAGNTLAQVRLGVAFEFGQGVDKNLDEAISIAARIPGARIGSPIPAKLHPPVT